MPPSRAVVRPAIPCHLVAAQIKALLSDIKIAHSVFALPFAALGAGFAARGMPDARTLTGSALLTALGLVLVAMVSARTAAMVANRLFDRHIDARNPRTANRPLAAGTASVRTYTLTFVVSCLVFMAACAGFWFWGDNPWPMVLSLPVLAWICAYGLFKRFTWACHLWLGASLAMSVPAAALALQPDTLRLVPAVWTLAAMVACWVAGFDVIYALQDVGTDVQEGLHSMPSRLGVRGAIVCSRLLHLAAAALLFLTWWIEPQLGTPFLTACFLTTGLLVVEHATLHRWGTSRMALTFFTINGVVSCVIGAAGLWDLI